MQLAGEWRQVLAALAASLSVVMIGTSYGWTSVALDTLLSKDSPIPMTVEESSWMVSIINLGELVSPVPTGVAANHLGRKWCLLATAPLYIFSWLMILVTRSVWVMCGIRIIQGVAMGMVCTIVPMYISEISSPHIRGTLTSLFSVMWYLGILLEYIFGAFLNFHNVIYASLVLPLIFFSAFLIMPESPYYLTIKQRGKDAEKSLQMLRNGNVAQELKEIQKSIEEEVKNKLSWREFFTQSSEFKSLIIVQILTLIKFFSGASAINSFANQTFSTNNTGLLTSSQYSISLGVIIVVATIFSGCLVDKVGRRPLFLISTLGCALSETGAAIYYYLNQNSTFLTKYDFVPFFAISLYFIFFSIGLSFLVPTFQAELFTSRTRSVASGITVSTSTIAIFSNMKTYQYIIERYGIYLNFAIFAVCCYAGFIFAYIFVPETKCKTFSEIQDKSRNRVNGGIEATTSM